jgi:hypothetical protein
MIQAEHGDCFLLEARDATDRTFVLVDGGPEDVYADHLRGKLNRIPGDRLDLAVLSHVDKDHIVGLQDLVADLRAQRATGEKELVEIQNLWINRFESTVDPAGNILPRMRAMVAAAALAGPGMSAAGTAVAGIPEGHSLQAQATAHGVPVNQGFPDGLVRVDTAPQDLSVGLFSLRVIGPTRENLEELQREWVAWLDQFEGRMDQPRVASNADASIPNLSSITFLAEADGITVLMTGDARGDHIVEGLREAQLLSDDGTFHVNVLKLQHHGSNRNITKKFFRKITADTYVISANGDNDNPDLSTLKWLVDAAHEQAREVEIVVTNATESTREIKLIRRPRDYGYKLKTLRRASHSKILRLS